MTYQVLIVDDSRLARMAVNKALDGLQPDWTRLEVSNADEALESFRNNSIDLALIDFNMHGRDGLSLAEELHAIRPKMPIAIISANYQIEIVNRTYAIGAAFLRKPLTKEALQEFLEVARARLESAPQ